MIKEYAAGLSNRHHFGKVDDIGKWAGMAQDTFMSLWDYDEHVVDYVKKKQSLSGYDGLIYMPHELILDVDGTNPENARQKCIGLTILLDELMVPYRTYFSGTGFHLGIPGAAFRWKPGADLHMKVKECLRTHGIYEYADPSVTDKTRLIRIVNTLNSKSKLWKIPITPSELNGGIEEILELAKNKRSTHKWETLECEPVFNALKIAKKETPTYGDKVSLGRNPDPIWYPCIQTMLEGISFGSRHATALRISAHLRWRYPESMVRMMMEDWRKRVDIADKPFTSEEMDNIVTHCYEGHGGRGNNYGCNDSIKDKHCKDTCILYRTKKSQTLMDANEMEKTLVDFYTRNTDPINLGKLYGKNFPIYPGEVVILQAPPKSMKTMLLQNWVNSFKRPTYFMEMEMSPRQIWSRFVMMEKGWDEEELRQHYSQYKNGVAEDFSWLTVDYNSCYPQEIAKRIMMLPVKPEILVVDHMGLFKTQKYDNNMKVEEVSQSLMEIAVQNNIVVFAVSEITKQAFHEGMDITSARGSFRIAYNANKVLSVTPYKNKESDDNMIKALRVQCTANREKENLDVTLNVNGTRIS